MIYDSNKSYWYKETLLRFRPYRDILNGCGDFHFTFFFLNLKYEVVIIFIQYSMHNINLIRKDEFSGLPDCKSQIVDKYIYN